MLNDYESALEGNWGVKGGLTPSPLRGEGRDEEWFGPKHNAINLTPALSLKRRGS
jgi:hypothetical protein